MGPEIHLAIIGDRAMNTRLTTLDLNKLTPHAVGFDRLFNNMIHYVDHQTANAGYPPYNILKDGDHFQIEMALAGVKWEDLDIELKENVLTISHVPTEVSSSETLQWIHKGIAQRRFTRHFTLADDVVVTGASMENGMLYIELERIVPEEKKPRKIAIAQNK
jgi:molecular chaperone IbpA